MRRGWTREGHSEDRVIKLALAAGVTALTWTVLRPHLVITDGTPKATDPFTWQAVAVVNLVLVLLSWGVASAGAQLVRWALGRGPG